MLCLYNKFKKIILLKKHFFNLLYRQNVEQIYYNLSLYE